MTVHPRDTRFGEVPKLEHHQGHGLHGGDGSVDEEFAIEAECIMKIAITIFEFLGRVLVISNGGLMGENGKDHDYQGSFGRGDGIGVVVESVDQVDESGPVNNGDILRHDDQEMICVFQAVFFGRELGVFDSLIAHDGVEDGGP